MRTLPVLALLGASLASGPALAQRHPLTPVVQLAFVGEVEPAVTGGARWNYTPTPQPVRDPETGMFRPVSASWSFVALATAGVTFAEGDPAGLTALGSAGLLRPRATGPVSAVGLVAMGSLRPDALGPAVRVETSYRALGAQAGVLWSDGWGGPRPAVAVDVTTAFLCDLFGC